MKVYGLASIVVVWSLLSSPSWGQEASEDLWVLRDASVSFYPDAHGLEHLGLRVDAVAASDDSDSNAGAITIGVDGATDVAAGVLGDVVDIVHADYVGMTGGLRLSTSTHEALVVGLLLDEPTLGLRADAARARDIVGDDVVLVLRDLRAGVNRTAGRLTLPSRSVVISAALADALGNPALAGESIGNAVVRGSATPSRDSAFQPLKAPLRDIRSSDGATGGVAGGGADMTFCQLFDLRQYGRTTTTLGLAVATTSWNVGTADLMWFQNPDSRHPFIVSNLYRLKDDRFEQIGQSWIKHGFFALDSEQCGTACTYEPGHGQGPWLGVGCTDTYTSSLNASQSGLGPRYEVNPWTGGYRFPDSHLSGGHGHDGQVDHRLQVAEADLLDGPGTAQYVVDGYYVVRDDIDHTNSVSWKTVTPNGTLGGTWSFSMSGAGTLPNIGYALNAWSGARQTVIAEEVPPVEFVSPDGRCVLASKATDLGDGMWHYEYALYNFDLNRKVQSFSIPTAIGATVENVEFHAVQSHGEPFSNVPWAVSVDPGSITWSTVDNPLRWGTLYNFRFDTDAEPIDTTATLGLFEVGTPGTLTGITDGPNTVGADCTLVASPVADGSGVANNRVLTVGGGNPGELTAIRVTMTSLLHPPDPVPVGTPDYSSFEGQVMWVGAPTEYPETPEGSGTFMGAELQCDPVFRDWGTVGMVNIFGPEIMPHSVYDVQEVHMDCAPVLGNELAYSSPLVAPTAHWGDVIAPFASDPGTVLPVDFKDIAACVAKFLDDPFPSKVRTKLSPGMIDLNENVSFADVFSTVQGFLGAPYTQDGPRTCP